MVAAQGVAHLPLMQRHDAIGKTGRQRQIVGHPEDAAALIGQFTQLAEQLAGQPLVEPGGDLVRQNVAGTAKGRGAGQNALGHAAGELARIAVQRGGGQLVAQQLLAEPFARTALTAQTRRTAQLALHRQQRIEALTPCGT